MQESTEAKYDTKQEGPFWRVNPRATAQVGAATQGLRGTSGRDPLAARRPARDTVSQPLEDADIRDVIRSKEGFAHQAANEYTQRNFNKPYSPVENSESSLQKQAPIGRAFALAATGHPEYKKAVFEAYQRNLPEAMHAKDYDDLLAQAYRQLAHETKKQFHSLPIATSYHRNGEGNYGTSKEMLKDIYNNKHLNVFQGGDPHEFLHEVDPATGLNTNEMFRAVHDFYGHAVHGTEFGPKGEEKAWAAHSAMFTPLAQAALTAETRGQNSLVNYSPLNAELKNEVRKLEEAAHHARGKGHHEKATEFDATKRELMGHFQFAPQKAVLLPPEMNRGDYAGGVPTYIRPLIKPAHGTTAELTHFSNEPNMTTTNPARYGTGIKGAEAERLTYPGAVRNRTHFYEGKPAQGEPGLGTNRYTAQAANLYDVGADPEHLGTLAKHYNTTPMSAPYNKGVADPVTAANDVERLAKEYGYSGVLNRNTQRPMAAVFSPLSVTKTN